VCMCYVCVRRTEASALSDGIEGRLLHHTQKKMRRRINLLLQIVEDSGGQGIEEKRLEEVLFANGVAEPALTQKYLRYLIDFGKVVREGTTLYSPNVKTVQTNLENVGLDGLQSHTHTSYTHEKGGSQG